MKLLALPKAANMGVSAKHTMKETTNPHGHTHGLTAIESSDFGNIPRANFSVRAFNVGAVSRCSFAETGCFRRVELIPICWREGVRRCEPKT